ncbi:hypothetical protein TSO221_31790 [Azospirillum sp. TSO22-1]|nr:hypothetical protein TSO221_31790 [Azospirillum sp. TSO22-1]
MAALFETAFEKAHPGTDVQVVWKQSREAAALLRQPDQGGIDVYWTPSLATFPAMRDAGAFRPLHVDRGALPGRIGAQPISDPKGFFEAFEVAGYGIVVNPATLAKLGLEEPRAWRDLTDSRYAGQVALPIAGQVGFSPALYDIILQGEGWERGWALLSELAGNAQLIGSGGHITDAVEVGTAAGLTVDFFARSAIANGHAVALAYPARTAFLPAQVAVTATAPHPDAARAFVDFVLGRDGQAILFHPDVRRYPVRPEVYAAAPVGTVNPFARPEAGTFAYDPELGIARAGLIAAVFERMIVERHDRLTALWAGIHRAEAALAKAPDPAAAALVAQARTLASAVPVSQVQATAPELLAPFRTRRTAHDGDGDPAAVERAWSQQLDHAHGEALSLLERALSVLPAGR